MPQRGWCSSTMYTQIAKNNRYRAIWKDFSQMGFHGPRLSPTYEIVYHNSIMQALCTWIPSIPCCLPLLLMLMGRAITCSLSLRHNGDRYVDVNQLPMACPAAPIGHDPLSSPHPQLWIELGWRAGQQVAADHFLVVFSVLLPGAILACCTSDSWIA